MKRPRRHTSIVVQMVCAFSALCAVLIFCISLAIYHGVARNVWTTLGENNRKLLNRGMERMDDLAGIITQTSFYVAGNETFRSLLKDFPESGVARSERMREIQSFLSSIWINRPEIVGMCLYMDSFTERTEETIGFGPVSWLKENGLLDALGNRQGIIITGEKTYLRSGYPFNMFSLIAIRQENGTVLGYLSFEVSASRVWDRCFADSLASSSSLLFAVNENGVIVSHSDASMIGRDAVDAYPVIASGSFLEEWEGERVMVLRSRRSNLGLTAIEIIPLSSIFNTDPIRYLIMAFCLAGIAVSAAIVFLLTRNITKPITTLSGLMETEKPLETKLPETYKDYGNEIGTLYRSYDKLLMTISRLLGQVEESMEKRRSAEVSALRSQITPHFLYNTLDYINWMAIDRGEEDISRMLSLLSRFLRLSITNNDVTSSVGKEADYAKAYLDIFTTKNSGSFTYEFSIDPSLREMQIPQFTLQPLVENCVLHGFGKHLAGGRIAVSVQRAPEGRVVFDIEDNGKGMDKEYFDAILSGRNETETRRGYGLRNINDRLRYSQSGFTGLELVPSERGTHIRFTLAVQEKGAIPCNTT